MVTSRQQRGSFPHLSLPLIVRGRARLTGGRTVPEQERENRNNREAHGAFLAGAASAAVSIWNSVRQERARTMLPELPPNIPLFVEVDPGSDLEYLRKHFNLEIVSEHNDGVILVASPDDGMAKFLNSTEAFIQDRRGGATAAKIYSLTGPDNTQLRIERILSESLLERWSTVHDAQIYTVDVGIECLGTITVPDTPEVKENETTEHFDARLERWRVQWRKAEFEWDDLMESRESQLIEFIGGYNGEVLDIVHGTHMGPATLPDSFTVRVRVTGLALRDLVLNYPYVFEVAEPDEISGKFTTDIVEESTLNELRLLPPDDQAPAVCVIDSGIQEHHPLLHPAIDVASSTCFIPGVAATDVGDYVRAGGHGTRVAGAIIYPKGIPTEGDLKLNVWIQNARVLDHNNRLSSSLYPPSYLKSIVKQFHLGPRSTRLFNHSIAAYRPCRLRNVSAWAAAMDWLSWQYDVLFFQSAGNLPPSSSALPFRLGVLDHLNSGFNYPDYLTRPSSRIPSPSESLQAITVGSVSHADYSGTAGTSFASNNLCSAFSTTGLGVWSSIKPDVVEYGGDFVRDNSIPPSITTPPDVCPELVRSTMHGGPLSGRDDVGTSYATPKVTAIGCALQSLLPEEPSLLYRALIINSARWPQWAENAANKLSAIQQLGFGIPDVERATQNTAYRVTMITSGLQSVKSKEAQIYRIPIPDLLRSPAGEFNVRIDVTLSYVAKPRRTRRSIPQYLSTWVDWRSIHLGESLESFTNRMLKVGDRTSTTNEGVIPWKIREQDEWGEIIGVRRENGTIQKDWAVLKSHQLPEDLCVAVRGHPGWDKDPDASAKYALTISFEAIDEDLEIYSPIETSLRSVIPVAEVQTEVRVAQDV
ncbi:S8 family peptidase [Undibacterium sp. TJN19]|uniref:S8 family peptidase n=1 Tax=Undibacterium sp. TJN19 TaxID=3413055 RepID=UPI003BEF9368